MAATLADVAARAGVSPATVSRVLNGNYPVAESTRQRVEKAIRELDYVVNAHARALLHATSGMVGVILENVADPYFGTLARGIQSAAEDMRRLVVVCGSEGNEATEFAYIEMLRRHRAEVVIVAGGAPEDVRYRREMAAHAKGLRAQGARLVLCGRPLPNRYTQAGVVDFDYAAGCQAIVSRLVDNGHRRIAYVSGPAGRTSSRFEAFRTALAGAGLALDDIAVVEGAFTRRSGYDAARRLLATGPAFTVLVAANDLMAIGALAAFREAGLAVPDDVSVVGFDDVPGAADVTPGLTTVRLPLEEAGRRAVSLAFAGQGFTEPVTLPVELVVRESLGAAARSRGRRSSRRPA